MLLVAVFLCGLLFGVGLLVSGMADPANVIGFLDLGGAWNPQLALVMAGAIGVAAPGFALVRRRARPLLGEAMHWPQDTAIDRRLIAGSLLFGVGWGLAGFCPGPALVGVGLGSGDAVSFTVAMLAGIYLHRKVGSRL
jgi:uncharacterized membrane protein YedE/YeeE